MNVIRIHPQDNVAVALEPLPKGQSVRLGGLTVTPLEDIQRGHKLALAGIPSGTAVIKYGCVIGYARQEDRRLRPDRAQRRH